MTFFENAKDTGVSVKMEEIIKLDKGSTESQKITTAEMDSILAGSITESLMGILPNEGKNLADYRGERLLKYE